MNQHRQFRFSLFLQVLGALMFLGAGIARGVLIGFDPVTIFFFLGGAAAAGLAVWTWRQLRDD